MSNSEPHADEPRFRPASPPEAPLMSINEIVSYNLMRARRINAWKQQDVADLLTRYTGRAWSNASVSAAERAWQGGRQRKFDANELVALTKIFDVPLGYFFLPPEDEHANKFVSMKKFEGGIPPTGPEALDRGDLMALMPTADYLEIVGANVTDIDYIARMKRLVQRYLGLDWRPNSWTVLFRANPETGKVEFAVGPAEDDRAELPEEDRGGIVKKPITWPLPKEMEEAAEGGYTHEVLEETESWRRVLGERISRIVEERIKEATKDIIDSVEKDMLTLIRSGLSQDVDEG